MNRHHPLFVFTIATFVVAVVVTASPADAQLFRRWRAARQPAAPSQYQQQQQRNQAYQQPRIQQPRIQQPVNQQRRIQQPINQQFQRQPSLPNQYRPNPQSVVPSANYPQVPKVVGPVRFPVQNAMESGNQAQSKSPTLAEQPKKVIDNLKTPEDDESDSNQSSQGDEELGQSILSRDAKRDDEPKEAVNAEAKGKEATRRAAASMGLEVFQYSTPQNGVRIARINETSKADESGIRVGDLIVAVDRTRTRSAKDIASILKLHQPGASLRVQFVRGTTSYVTNVPLIASKFSRNGAGATASSLPANAPSKSGDKQPAKENRVAAAKPPIENAKAVPSQIKLGMLIQDPASLRGTVVTKVRPGSIADVSDLKAGDRIVSVESKLLEGGNQLRDIVSRMSWGDQLAIGIVRDGELISRKVKFDRTPEKKLAASEPTKNSNPTKSTSSLGKGLGSMLGGLFASGTKTESKGAKPESKDSRAESKDTQAESKDTQRSDKVVRAGGAVPEPAESPENIDDPLGFGDDEPIEQVIFQKKTAAR